MTNRRRALETGLIAGGIATTLALLLLSTVMILRPEFSVAFTISGSLGCGIATGIVNALYAR